MRSVLRPRPGTRLLAPSLALLVGLAVGGCSGEESGDAGSGPSEPSAAPTLEVEPVTDLGRVTGKMSRKEARAVEERVSRITVRWLTEAYVGEDYPRERFTGAFADFSRGARAAARSDLRVLSNTDIGPRVDAVTPTKMRVEVDLLAVRERAVGATARVLTTFRTEGSKQGRYRVSGRLLLTKREGRWTVFAYHVSKGAR